MGCRGILGWEWGAVQGHGMERTYVCRSARRWSQRWSSRRCRCTWSTQRRWSCSPGTPGMCSRWRRCSSPPGTLCVYVDAGLGRIPRMSQTGLGRGRRGRGSRVRLHAAPVALKVPAKHAASACVCGGARGLGPREHACPIARCSGPRRRTRARQRDVAAGGVVSRGARARRRPGRAGAAGRARCARRRAGHAERVCSARWLRGERART